MFITAKITSNSFPKKHNWHIWFPYSYSLIHHFVRFNANQYNDQLPVDLLAQMDTNNNNNNNNLFTYIAPFNIYGMIKGALQSKKTNITIDNYNKNAIYNR